MSSAFSPLSRREGLSIGAGVGYSSGMRVVEYDRYGGSDVLRIRDAAEEEPGAGEVRVRVRAAALNPKDLALRSGRFRLFTRWYFPLRVAYDWAGEVAAIGPGVRDVSVGDRLFGMINAWRGGACADSVVVRLSECAPMPAGLGFEEAAALPLAALTSLQALRDIGRVGPGSSVCINGGSGGVGVFAIQVGRALGARITSVSSAANAELCRSLGAAETLDYAKDDLLAGRRWDVFFDVVGNHDLRRVRPSLAPRGAYISTVLGKGFYKDILRTALGRKRARFVSVRSRRADLFALTRLVEEGRLRAVIDRTFPFDEIIAAQDFLATKRARGKVVIRVDPRTAPAPARDSDPASP